MKLKISLLSIMILLAFETWATEPKKVEKPEAKSSCAGMCEVSEEEIAEYLKRVPAWGDSYWNANKKKKR